MLGSSRDRHIVASMLCSVGRHRILLDRLGSALPDLLTWRLSPQLRLPFLLEFDQKLDTAINTGIVAAAYTPACGSRSALISQEYVPDKQRAKG